MKPSSVLIASNPIVFLPKLSCPLLLIALFIPSVEGQAIKQPVPPKPGVLANTYTAVALTPGEKFDYRLYRGFLVRGIIGSAFSAGIAQWNNTPEEWGGGASAYGKRFASSIGTSASRQGMLFGMETVLHQDPRFFPSTSKGFKARLGNVIKQVFVAKNDSGEAVPAYGRLVSAFGAGQLTNAWQPASNNSVGDGLIRGAFIVGADFGVNLLTEFVPAFRKRVYKIDKMHR